MRIFQNSGIYASYKVRLADLTKNCSTFKGSRDIFLNDRFGACHFLKPILDGSPNSFFTNGDDRISQGYWAREQGMPKASSLEDILLAQIEDHRTEIFYNLDPMRYGSDFVKKLPGCVAHTVAWRAAPSPGADFSSYSVIVCNFPSIIKSYQDRGWNSAYLSPAHDSIMDSYAINTQRPIDVLFVGGYTRHHKQRASILEMVSMLADDYKIVYMLDSSRLTKLAESTAGKFLPLKSHRRPINIQKVSSGPVFGLELYRALSKARIVLNGAIDMAGNERGNMRCFEAMGCGALMVGDHGVYPQGMIPGNNFLSYKDPNDVVSTIQNALANPERAQEIARNGFNMIRTEYDKNIQWKQFQEIVEGL